MAEETYFKDAVCLSTRGKIQARTMGEFVKLLKIPIQKVISSPSCRGRQTAQLAFGGYDEIKNIFLHFGPFNETIEEYVKNVKKEILKINVKEGSNVIISAHGAVIYKETFDEIFNSADKKQIRKLILKSNFISDFIKKDKVINLLKSNKKKHSESKFLFSVLNVVLLSDILK